jgi:hypothetical protein
MFIVQATYFFEWTSDDYLACFEGGGGICTTSGLLHNQGKQ